MDAPQGTVRVCRQGPTLTFAVEGWARMPQSVPLRQRAERELADGVTAVRVDLRRCAYMDSTFLGTLLFLKRKLACLGTFALLSPSEACLRLLRQMGLGSVFAIETAEEPSDEWTDLPVDAVGLPELRCRMVEAHEELARVEGPAGAPFRDLVHGLHKELQAEKAH